MSGFVFIDNSVLLQTSLFQRVITYTFKVVPYSTVQSICFQEIIWKQSQNFKSLYFLELSYFDRLLCFNSTPLCLPAMTLLVVLRWIPLCILLFPNGRSGAVVLAGTCDKSFFRKSFFLFPSLKLQTCYSTVIHFMELRYMLTWTLYALKFYVPIGKHVSSHYSKIIFKSIFWVKTNSMELQEVKLEETSFLSKRAYFYIFLSLGFSSFLHCQKIHLIRVN